jgi:UDPglucose--hexose-1-phosphate uridylyltransferase
VNPTETEYRICSLTGQEVLIAPARAARPMALDHASPHQRDDNTAAGCPFCEGMEHETTNEVYASRSFGTTANGPGWQIRIVPNKFPAVVPTEKHFGIHDLVIESPRHVSNPADLTPLEWIRLFTAYRHRIRELFADPRVKSVNLFKNVGAEAGASLPHSHSQIISLPFVPRFLEHKLRRCEQAKSPLMTVEVERARESGRVVAENDRYIVFCPYAPRFEYEMWLVPKNYSADFRAVDSLGEQTTLFRDTLLALDEVARFPAYNWILNTAPPGREYGFVWHWEILPRTTRGAGFEWGTGCAINAIPPENAARCLRQAIERLHLQIPGTTLRPPGQE